MRIALGILLLIGLAVVATNPKFLKLRRATIVGTLVSGGWFGVIIGLTIGPTGLALVPHDLALDASPLLTIGLGWIGLMIGLQLRPEILRRLPARLIHLALIDALVSVTMAGALAWFLLSHNAGAPAGAALAAASLAAAASIGWPAETRSLGLFTTESATVGLTLRAASGLGAPLAIAVFALLTASIDATATGRPIVHLISPILRLLGLAGVAVILGMVARFGLRRAGEERSDLLVIFLGVVALIAGAAVELRMSPLLSAMLAGIVITNLAGRELRRFERFILEAEHVVAVIFSIVAGVLMDARIGLLGLALAVALLALRLTVKPPIIMIGIAPADDSIPPRTRRLARLGAVRQSPLALMLGVGLVLADPSPINHRMLTLLAVVGLSSDVFAMFLARSKGAHDQLSSALPSAGASA